MGSKSEFQSALAEMDQDKVKRKLLEENCDFISFRMNVPHTSHMGGSWERQIRLVRGILSGLLDVHGDQLDDE